MFFSSSSCSFFQEDKNPKGSCEYAPDCLRSTINTITCIGCAQCVCYHCARDAEGDFAQHPCDCTMDESCTKRWLCLTLLSFFVPCLWFYPPLRWCHQCGIKCGICGGRHSMWSKCSIFHGCEHSFSVFLFYYCYRRQGSNTVGI